MLVFVLAQSESYPKLWMLTFRIPGSIGNQYCGQKKIWSLPFRHVLKEPPRRPWTNITSISGSGDECTNRKPNGPRTPSFESLSFSPLLAVGELLKRFPIEVDGHEECTVPVYSGPECDVTELTFSDDRDVSFSAALWALGVSLSFRPWFGRESCLYQHTPISIMSTLPLFQRLCGHLPTLCAL